MIDVCICTHNPRLDVLGLVVDALTAQTAASDEFNVVLIDNASTSPISDDVLRSLVDRNVLCRVVREEAVGLMHARLRAIGVTTSEWIVFVDDDNELAPDYIEQGLIFIKRHADTGCFGGRLLLPPHLKPPRRRELFLPFLGIRDLGDDEIVGRSKTWCTWEPPGAGAWVRRPVLDIFTALSRDHPEALSLGRAGQSLASGDDSLLMSCADAAGLTMGYAPSLKLWHHISPHRYRLSYLMKLMRAYGESNVQLLRAQGAPVITPYYYRNSFMVWVSMLASLLRKSPTSIAFAIAQTQFHQGAASAYRAQKVKTKINLAPPN